MNLLKLSLKSAWNRKFSLSLTIISIAISILLLLGVDMIRKQAKDNFVNTISKTDLIVGARSGPVNLLLYSVFRMGDATNNISWESYEEIKQRPEVAWTIPLSLGDSHRGYRVLGTNQDYFKYYQFAGDQFLTFEQGKPFKEVFDVVLGSEIAKQLNYQLGQKIVLSHGLSSHGLAEHDDKPFVVTGILKPTGTPVDRTVHISLKGITAIHVDWQSGRRNLIKIDADKTLKMDLQPKAITAFMIGLKKRITTFKVQRFVNEYPQEAMMAIIPGATLSSFWRTLNLFEKILFAISVLVVISSLIGMLTTIMNTLNERRREMAVLRALGAHPYQIILLFMAETFVIICLSISLALLLLLSSVSFLSPFLLDWFGINIQAQWLDWEQIIILLSITLLALFISLIPGYMAYKKSLQDGLLIKI